MLRSQFVEQKIKGSLMDFKFRHKSRNRQGLSMENTHWYALQIFAYT